MLSLPSNGVSVPIIEVSGGATTIPPTPINAYSIMSIPPYRRAMAFLADNLARFPRSVRDDGAKIEGGHKLDTLLKRRPNQLQNPFVFWRTLFFHVVHTMNGYARIERDPVTSEPIALCNRRPEQIMPFRFDAGDGTGLQQFYLDRSDGTVVRGQDMIHLQGLSWDGQLGTDPAIQCSQTFQQATTLQRYVVQYWSKGTCIRAAVEVKEALTPEQVDEVRATLRKFRGVSAEEDILILHSGGHLNNATTSPQQSQLVEQTAASTKAIAQITGVPPEFLFELSEAKYNASVELAGQFVVRFTLGPWIELIQSELTLKLLTFAEQDKGLTVKLNPDALLRGDTKTQAEVVKSLKDGGITDANESRAMLELPPRTEPEANKLSVLGSAPATVPAAT